MSPPADDRRLEDALRGDAAVWREPSPRPGLAARVRADLAAGTAGARTIPWFTWIPAGAALGLAALFLGSRLLQPPAPDTLPQALELASVPDQLARWPEWVDRAGDPYRREWEAVAEDLAATRSFMVSLVDRLPTAN